MSRLKDLAELAGIASEYINEAKELCPTSDDVRTYFLENMGYPCHHEIENTYQTLRTQIWHRGLDYVHAFFTDEDKKRLLLHLPERDCKAVAEMIIEDEQKNITHTQIALGDLPIQSKRLIGQEYFVTLRVPLTAELSAGYYTLRLQINGKTYETMLIIASPKCYLAEGVAEEKLHVFGLAIQLYALRSDTNMGIGDFSDLKEIIKLVAENGGDAVGINPLGTLFPESRTDVSPYRTISRAYISYVYVDLRQVPEFKDAPKVRTLMDHPEVQSQLRYLRETNNVDYYGVFKFKRLLLKPMFEYFQQTHLGAKITERGQMFLDFIREKGESLHHMCIFEALIEMYGEDGRYNDWRYLPKNYSDIHSEDTQNFIKEQPDLIQFYAYCHWLADGQLKEAAQLCEDLNMKVGLYQDSPVGASSSGAEVWENREVYAEKMGVGAPPDILGPRGQSWGFSPYHPQKIREYGYKPFITVIRENMRTAKALRIDHAMGLMRLFWVFFEENNPVVQGAYVYYHLKEMVAILSVESHRHKCMLIGEDLGTVPDGFREYMFTHGLLSNKVFIMQKTKKNVYLPPKKYQYLSLAQFSTHDQATAYGFWKAQDIHTFNECGSYVSKEQYHQISANRNSERRGMLKAFIEQDTFPDEEAKTDMYRHLNGDSVPMNFEYTANKYAALANSAVYLLRIEDIYGQIAMENVPGTTCEYPNWRIKLQVPINKMREDGRFQKLFDFIRCVRK